MDIDNTHLTLAEWHRRLTQKWCLYCGTGGHYIAFCIVQPPQPMVSSITCPDVNTSPLTSVVTLTASDVSISVTALLDSGSASNFISGDSATNLISRKSPMKCLQSPVSNRQTAQLQPCMILCGTHPTPARMHLCGEHHPPGSGEVNCRCDSRAPLAHETQSCLVLDPTSRCLRWTRTEQDCQ